MNDHPQRKASMTEDSKTASASANGRPPRYDPDAQLELTHIRWRNRETRYDDGRRSTRTKVIAMRGNDLFASLEYGKFYPATTPRQQGRRLIDRNGKETGAAWWDGPDQPGLAHCPNSGTWVHDVDDRARFEETELADYFGWADRWIERDDDPDHFHVLFDARAVPVELWPAMGKTDLSNTIKTNGFTPVPGCDHHSGGHYAGVQSGRLIRATPEMAAALVRCRAAADERLRELAPARTGGGGSGMTGKAGKGHDTEMAGYCLELAHQGLDEDRIYELWSIKAAAEEDPAWPFDDSDFTRHMRHVYAKVETFRERVSFPAFTPPPAEVTAAMNGNGNGSHGDPPPVLTAQAAEAPGDPEDQEESNEPDGLEVTNSMVLFRTLCHRLGTGPLSGVFNRADELVVVPRYGEVGYRAASDAGRTAADPPAKIRALDADSLVSFIAGRVNCYTVTKTKEGDVKYSPALPKAASCKTVVKAMPESWLGVPPLAGVTHTPLIRPDGSILALPGYDRDTRLLYLPECEVPPVPEIPSAADVGLARSWLELLVHDFRFVSDGDRANYLGALITPVMRLVLPPPWPVLALNAPMLGSGKTLLSELLRILHGGTQHTAPGGRPGDADEEIRKQVTAILAGQTGGVVVFDNVTGVLRSGNLAALLTGAGWSDRMLGTNRTWTGPNDRLWVITGNNIALGGDLPRRALWATIDPGCPEPWNRAPGTFKVPDLPGWTRDNRGTLLWAMLTLARHGYLTPPAAGQARTDSYGKWAAGIAHLLSAAGIGGGFWARETNAVTTGADDEDWAEFLAAVWAGWGTQQWTARQLAEACSAVAPGEYDRYGQPLRALTPFGEALPGELADKLARTMDDPKAIARSLGKWLKNRAGRWAGGYMIKAAGTHADITSWCVAKS